MYYSRVAFSHKYGRTGRRNGKICVHNVCAKPLQVNSFKVIAIATITEEKLDFKCNMSIVDHVFLHNLPIYLSFIQDYTFPIVYFALQLVLDL